MSFQDLEQGHARPGRGDPSKDRVHGARDAPGASLNDFEQLAEKVGLHVFRITSNIKTLRQLEGRLRQADDIMQRSDSSLGKQFNDLSEQTRAIVKDATDDVKALSLFPLPSNAEDGYAPRTSPERLTQAKLQREFQQALAAFQSVQKAGIRMEKAALETARTKERHPPARRDAADMELLEPVRQYDTQQEGEQMQLQASKQVPEAEIEFQQLLIAEREAEIREIETGVQELNEIFRDLGHIVQEQGDMIDNIEYNINSLATNTQGADRELLDAHAYQRRSGRRMLCLTIIIAFVVAIVLLAILG